MSAILRSASLYFLAVFGTGFLLGTVRVLWLAPSVGARTAELLEMPVMLAVMIVAAYWTVRRTALVPRPLIRLGTGVFALVLVLIAEFMLVLSLRGLSVADYFAGLDPLTASAYYATLGIFALLPLAMGPASRRMIRVVGGVSAVLVLGALTYVNYRHDLEVERQRVSAGSLIAQTPCGPIEYASIGQGPALLLVHGAGGGFDQTVDIARELAGFRVITTSRFGYLRTPLPRDASPAAQADAHACLLDALHIDRTAIIGASAGAPSSMQFALRHSERCTALLLLVPIAYAPPPGQTPVAPSLVARFMFEKAVRSDFFFWLAVKTAPSLVLKTLLGTSPEVLPTVDADERARVATLMRHILPLSLRQQGLLNDASIAASLPRYELETFAVPTLVVSSADDLYGTYESARYSAAHIRGARFIGYPSGGHVWAGHHAELLREIKGFLGGRDTMGTVSP
jgi:2-hydroxy-6-oxonona-2,4-dienedioate hydrolase